MKVQFVGVFGLQMVASKFVYYCYEAYINYSNNST